MPVPLRAVLLVSLLCTSAYAQEPFNSYGAQRGARAGRPSTEAVDSALRSRSQHAEDRQREDMMQERSEYLDKNGYDYGRRAEAGDRFRYGADRTADDFARANAPDRLSPESRARIDTSGNLRPPYANAGGHYSGSYSGSTTTTNTTTVNQSRNIDASGNLVP